MFGEKKSAHGLLAVPSLKYHMPSYSDETASINPDCFAGFASECCVTHINCLMWQFLFLFPNRFRFKRFFSYSLFYPKENVFAMEMKANFYGFSSWFFLRLTNWCKNWFYLQRLIPKASTVNSLERFFSERRTGTWDSAAVSQLPLWVTLLWGDGGLWFLVSWLNTQ